MQWEEIRIICRIDGAVNSKKVLFSLVKYKYSSVFIRSYILF